MKINELRIGNIVYKDDTSFPSPVDLNTFIILSRFPERETWIKGVPLSEQWLTDNGFTRVKPRIGVAASFTLKYINTVRLNLSNSGNFYYGQKFIGSVHEVQNLVFALTGRELIIEK